VALAACTQEAPVVTSDAEDASAVDEVIVESFSTRLVKGRVGLWPTCVGGTRLALPVLDEHGEWGLQSLDLESGAVTSFDVPAPCAGNNLARGFFRLWALGTTVPVITNCVPSGKVPYFEGHKFDVLLVDVETGDVSPALWRDVHDRSNMQSWGALLCGTSGHVGAAPVSPETLCVNRGSPWDVRWSREMGEWSGNSWYVKGDRMVIYESPEHVTFGPDSAETLDVPEHTLFVAHAFAADSYWVFASAESGARRDIYSLASVEAGWELRASRRGTDPGPGPHGSHQSRFSVNSITPDGQHALLSYWDKTHWTLDIIDLNTGYGRLVPGVRFCDALWRPSIDAADDVGADILIFARDTIEIDGDDDELIAMDLATGTEYPLGFVRSGSFASGALRGNRLFFGADRIDLLDGATLVERTASREGGRLIGAWDVETKAISIIGENSDGMFPGLSADGRHALLHHMDVDFWDAVSPDDWAGPLELRSTSADAAAPPLATVPRAILGAVGCGGCYYVLQAPEIPQDVAAYDLIEICADEAPGLQPTASP